ncbi:hypothetical protein SAY87_000460 [Trapa incisa]|uniref:RING-type domain-containing protein n=1 Tax=Trapa incisa TaxID=236973 RepID=A0AAN7GIP6_9MYRT|nr:hypothetical protein SAY87_000460 [Trapa incisa]
MASSQVEMAAASAPFGCILRNHSRRDRCRDSTALRQNLKDLVTSINLSPDPNDNEQTADGRQLKLVSSNQEKEVFEEKQHCLDSDLGGSDQAAAITSGEPETDGGSNLGASSLVQIWEARLGHSNSMNRAATASTWSNCPLSCSNENPSTKPGGLGDAMDENRLSQDGLTADWDSDRTVPEVARQCSASSSTFSSMSQDRNPDPKEGLKTPRVADIIRRLISANDENDNEVINNGGAEAVGSDHSSEQKGFVVQVTNSPRLRGRHAFNHLLVLMERDRQKELDSLGQRHAVSRFSQKGRIQANLRLKVLQRGMSVHIQSQQRPMSSGSEGSTSSRSSSIVHLREKFKAESSKVAENTNPTPPHTRSANKCHVSKDCSSITSVRSNVTESHRVEVKDTSTQDLVPEHKQPVITEDHQDEREIASKSTHQLEKLESFEVQGPVESHQEQEVTSSKLQEQAEPYTSINGCWYDEGMVEEEEGQDSTVEEEGQESIMEEEELMASEEGGYEWFLGVSRPRSYWEGQRQAWYRQILETESENSDIRKLLERRSVSTFLTSDFHDRMNCLMVNHFQRQIHHMSEPTEDEMSNEERMNRFLSSFMQNHPRLPDGQEEKQVQKVEEVIQQEEAKEEEEHICSRSGERRGQLMVEEEEQQICMNCQPNQDVDDGKALQEKGYRERVEDEEEEEEEEESEEQGKILIEEDNYEVEDHNDDVYTEEEEEEEEESMVGQKYHEASQYFNHSNPSSVTMPSPTSIRSWSYRSHEMGNNDHQALASTSSREMLHSNPYYNDAWQHINSIDHISSEMGLINEMREQMKQLYQEMSELRKSINSCMDMQVKFQDSIKEDLFSARGKRMKPKRKASSKGHCRICCKKQIDSLLYRCGHMCTCLKCAQELQWNGGNCPICRDPIDDVVQVLMDS